MIDPRLDRWLMASIVTAFKARNDALADPYSIYVEGQDRPQLVTRPIVELRVDGPYLTALTANETLVYIEVNALIQLKRTGLSAYAIRDVSGTVASWFIATPLIAYGDGDAVLGCLELVEDKSRRERIQVNHFGIIDPDRDIMQASVEGHFRITI